MNDTPRFRNPDKLQVLPYRDWLWRNLPPGRSGYVVEDLDLVLRIYGPMYDSDADGRLMFVELKFGNTTINPAQRKTFGLIDNLMRRGDPDGRRYAGYFVLNYADEDWDVSSWFRVNGVSLTREQLIAFVQFDSALLETIRSSGVNPLGTNNGNEG